MAPKLYSNIDIASMLDRIGDLLDAKGENPFRVRSYRTAAESIRAASGSVAQKVRKSGADGLAGLKGVGEKLAGLIQEYIDKGEVELLTSLEKEVPLESRKATPVVRPRHVFPVPLDISVSLILSMDQEYRKKAAAGKLKKIAPKKFNPDGEAWLPILATEREGVRFTVMFSNTKTAHDLKKTDDWVVVYYEKGKGENQCTVVTESRGHMKGKRVIRGREEECRKYYDS